MTVLVRLLQRNRTYGDMYRSIDLYLYLSMYLYLYLIIYIYIYIERLIIGICSWNYGGQEVPQTAVCNLENDEDWWCM